MNGFFSVIRKFFLRIGAAAVCICLLNTMIQPASAEVLEPVLASEAAVLMDADTGEILYEKNGSKVLFPASITKVMTGMLALENANPANEITLSLQGYRQVSRTSSHINLAAGETMTLNDAMYALALVSANDAAIAIAETLDGSVEAFSDRMNRRARELGAENTHFVNPNGMPNDDHYTTALDMALITRQALKTPGFVQYFGAAEYEMPATNLSKARSLVSKNQFIDERQPCPGLLISKTGFTVAAQGTLVTAVERDGITLIAVTLKSPMLEDKYSDTAALMDYGYCLCRKLNLDAAALQPYLVAAGMNPNFAVKSMEEISHLLPFGYTQQQVQAEIIGGFDAIADEITIPVELSVQLTDGTNRKLEDLLVTVERVRPDPTEAAPEAPEEKRDRPNTVLYFAIAGAAAVMLILFAGTKRRSPVN